MRRRYRRWRRSRISRVFLAHVPVHGSVIVPSGLAKLEHHTVCVLVYRPGGWFA